MGSQTDALSLSFSPSSHPTCHLLSIAWLSNYTKTTLKYYYSLFFVCGVKYRIQFHSIWLLSNGLFDTSEHATLLFLVSTHKQWTANIMMYAPSSSSSSSENRILNKWLSALEWWHFDFQLSQIDVPRFVTGCIVHFADWLTPPCVRMTVEMCMRHFDWPLKCNDAYMDFGNTISQRNFIVKWALSGDSYRQRHHHCHT